MARPMVKITAGEIVKILTTVLKKMDKDIADFQKAKTAYPVLMKAWEKKAHRFIIIKGASTLGVNVARDYNSISKNSKAFASMALPLSVVEREVGKRPVEPVDPRWDEEYHTRGKKIPAQRRVLDDALTIYKMANPKEKVSVPVNAEWAHFIKY